MKPFDLEAFKAGQKASTREGRIATFIGINLQLHKDSQLVTVLDDNDYTTFYYINGNYNKDKEHKLDLVSMVSRHQALINSYDPEDTWQVRSFDRSINDDFETAYGKPSFDEMFEYRLHPHNDLIKAWKKGAKIECKHKDIEWRDASSDDIRSWYEDAEYRIKPEIEFTYPIYKQSKCSNVVVEFTDLATGKVLVGNDSCKVDHVRSFWFPHTDTGHWQDWTPITKPEPTIHCLCYNPGHVHGEFSWSPSIATKELAVANGWTIIKEWEV